jgi:hypothetical protein
MASCDIGESGRDEFFVFNNVCIDQQVFRILDGVHIALSAILLVLVAWRLKAIGPSELRRTSERTQSKLFIALFFLLVIREVVNIVERITRIVRDVTLAERHIDVVIEELVVVSR